MESEIQEILRGVNYPGYSRDIVSFGLVKSIRRDQGVVHIQIQLTAPNPEIAQKIRHDCDRLLQARGIRAEVEVMVPTPTQTSAMAAGYTAPNKIPGLNRIVAVASGKGGVGKSTVSVNLACAFQKLGVAVGLLDCDIYGPSIPLMMGVRQRPVINGAEKLVPPIAHGVPVMSMGILVEGDSPVIWRGPMIMKTIQQFFHQVEWGKLDLLLVDLPPGTGDAQLSLAQTVPLDGGVIVTTPQEASVGVVRKGIGMFQKVNVPLLGLIENMSYFTTSHGERVEIFGHGGGQREAGRQKIPFLGEIPIFPEIREAGDLGVPLVSSQPAAPASKSFLEIAHKLAAMLGISK